MMDASDYATNAPQGYMGDGRRGAPLGRPSLVPEDAAGMRVQLRPIHLDEGGYDDQGTYFGVGEPVWWAATTDGSLDATLRARDEADAVAQVLTMVPSAIVDVSRTAALSGRAADLAADPGLAAYLGAILQDARDDEAEDARSEGREAGDLGTIETLPEATYQTSLADWRRFADSHAADITAAGALEPGGDGFSFANRPMTLERIGSTLWLARTGSGVGFTDDGDADCLQRLGAAAEEMGRIEPYLGDDGALHLG